MRDEGRVVLSRAEPGRPDMPNWPPSALATSCRRRSSDKDFLFPGDLGRSRQKIFFSSLQFVWGSMYEVLRTNRQRGRFTSRLDRRKGFFSPFSFFGAC